MEAEGLDPLQSDPVISSLRVTSLEAQPEPADLEIIENMLFEAHIDHNGARGPGPGLVSRETPEQSEVSPIQVIMSEQSEWWVSVHDILKFLPHPDSTQVRPQLADLT